MIDKSSLEGAQYNYAIIQEEFQAVTKPFYEKLKETCIINPFSMIKNPPPVEVRDQYSQFMGIYHVNLKLFPLEEAWFKLIGIDQELNKKLFVDACRLTEFHHVFKEFEKDVDDYFYQYQPTEFSELNRGVVWATQDKNPDWPLVKKYETDAYFEIALSISYSSTVRLPAPSLLAVKMEESDEDKARNGWKPAYVIKKMDVVAAIISDLTIKVDSCQCRQ